MNLMDLSFSEDQDMLKTTAGDFLRNECPPSLVRELEASEEGYSPELWRKIAELGWLGLGFPDEYGGEGGNLVDLMILCTEMGRVLFPSPYFSTVALGGLTILEAGSEEQKMEFLPEIAKGEYVLTQALLETSNTYEAEGMNVRAIARGDNYIVDGTKLLVANAHIADWLICVTRTRLDDPAEEGLTLFLVDAKSPGIAVTSLPNIAKAKLNAVEFQSTVVPKRNMLGQLNKGWAPLQRALLKATVLQCAEIVGACSEIQRISVQYAKDRVQYEVPIGIHQSIQWKCVDMGDAINKARVLTHTAAAALNDDEPALLEVALAKACANQTARFCAYEGHQIHSGVGQLVDHNLTLYSPRLKAFEVNLGNTDYHLDKIADALGLSTLTASPV